MGAPSGHPLKYVQKSPLVIRTLRINFGQNYRDLGYFVRVTFMAKITGTLLGTSMGTLSGTHFSVPLREMIAPSGQACMHGGAHICSVPLHEFYLRAPSGPLMGTLSGTHVGTLSGTHFSKGKVNFFIKGHPAKNNGLEPIP